MIKSDIFTEGQVDAKHCQPRDRSDEKSLHFVHEIIHPKHRERTVMATRKIAVLVGSLRKESFTRKLAKSLMLAAPPTLELEIVDIAHLPMYNEDDETGTPPPRW